jgi:pilus assembly protein Flp/PilA
MKDKFLLLSIAIKNLVNNDEGQDLVEYALVVSLVAFGALAAMSALGTEISTVFSSIKSVLVVSA